MTAYFLRGADGSQSIMFKFKLICKEDEFVRVTFQEK